MRKIVSASIVVALALSSVNLVWPGEAKDGRAVIEKAIKAAGGEANLAKIKAATWKQKGTYYGMGEGLPYTGEYAAQWPGQFRMEIENAFINVFNKDKGWTLAGGEVKEMSKEQLAVQQHDGKVSWMNTLLPLMDKAFEFKSMGEAKVGKEPALVVKVSRKDYPTVTMYFDKKTHLLVKSEYTTKAADLEFKEVKMEANYSDHKDVNGIKMPHKTVLHRDGKIFVEAENTEIKALGKLDDKVFGRPSSD
jgi:hypothetical protein